MYDYIVRSKNLSSRQVNERNQYSFSLLHFFQNLEHCNPIYSELYRFNQVECLEFDGSSLQSFAKISAERMSGLLFLTFWAPKK